MFRWPTSELPICPSGRPTGFAASGQRRVRISCSSSGRSSACSPEPRHCRASPAKAEAVENNSATGFRGAAILLRSFDQRRCRTQAPGWRRRRARRRYRLAACIRAYRVRLNAAAVLNADFVRDFRTVQAGDDSRMLGRCTSLASSAVEDLPVPIAQIGS